MKVLIIGSGGREHALAWAMARSPSVERVWVAPGNAGAGAVAENVDLDTGNLPALVRFARDEGVDLTVPGPEAVLAAGVTDAFLAEGLAVCGPTRAAAAIESSKAFAKDLMRRHGIPTADYAVFDRLADAEGYIDRVEHDLVVKADGLAAGKGVTVCRTADEAKAACRRCLADETFGAAGARVVLEERLEGEEVSVLALTDGRTIAPLASAQDHKPAFDNDEGPNTGGMGAYSPAPVLTPDLEEQVVERILVPTVHAMQREGRPFRGVLYAGLMITRSGPKVVEFNCRFGDPEIQPLVMRLASDPAAHLLAVPRTRLGEETIRWRPGAAACVVMASGGYPGAYKTGLPIEGLDEAAALEGVEVFHAGTARRGGRIVTAGGRVLGVTAVGDDLAAAVERAYAGVGRIRFEGAHYRTDIGARALAR